MKIVTPTIIEPWREEVESAKTLARLRELLVRLQTFTVLDPACGSGNFLYTAYREVKRIEARIYERMAEDYKSVDPAQRPFGFVTVRNFHGMDINVTAIEIAKVTMMLAHKLAIDELHITENALPLDNLDDNFRVVDALVSPDGSLTVWPKTDVIIGNPPFIGAKKLKPQRGAAYANLVRGAYPGVPGMPDYCVYWLRKSHETLPQCTADDPVRGRAGLVGTQNIRNSQHRVGGLDFITQDGTIIEAVDNQPWSGEAQVNVSIVNWAKTKSAALVPTQKRLWFKASPERVVSFKKARGGRSSSQTFELDSALYPHISAALSGGVDTTGASELNCNTHPQRVFQGITPGHAAFVLSRDEKDAFVKRDAKSAEVIYPYLIGSEMLTGTGAPKRFLIDFQPLSLPAATAYGPLFNRIEKRVLTDRLKKSGNEEGAENETRPHHKAFLKRWWRLSWERSEMIGEIAKLRKRYIVCSRVTKRPVFTFVSKSIRPGDRLQTFMLDDDYSFGILQSRAHWEWFVARCPKQTERFIYTPEEVFNSFPWPQSATNKQVEAVAKQAKELRNLRTQLLIATTGGLRGLYRTLELPGENPLSDMQSALDLDVMAAFGFSSKRNVLTQLFGLNRSVAHAIVVVSLSLGQGFLPGSRNLSFFSLPTASADKRLEYIQVFCATSFACHFQCSTGDRARPPKLRKLQ